MSDASRSIQPADDHSRRVFDEAADGLFVASPDGVYLQVNRAGHRLLGYADGELVGKQLSSLLLRHDLARLRTTLEGLASGKVQQQIWPMLRKDREVVHLEVTGQRLSDGNLLGVVRALEARSELERKALASEAKLASILHTAPDIILTVDRDGRILFINRTLPPTSVDQVVGTSCYDYVPVDAKPRVAEAIERVFTTGSLDEYEVRGPPDPTGQRGWSSVRAGPLIEGDRVVAATLCATDVTAHKREAARTQELLERLRKIASLLPGVVYQYQLNADGSSCFPYASERLFEIFRVTPEAAREDASAVLAAIVPDDRAGVDASLRQSARALERWQREFRIAFADGRERWLYGDAVPELAADGSTLWHGLITDVTERKHAEQVRARLEAQLLQAQKMESVGQLAGGVAHDFNNMLTAVVAFVELAQDILPADTPAAEFHDGILAAAARGAALTQQLLAFARKKIVQPVDASVNELLERMAPMIRRLVGEHIAVELQLGPELPSVRVDVGSLEQVIMNLIVNARDAMPKGGRLALQTRLLALAAADHRQHPQVPPGEHLLLSVTDTGSGISPEHVSHLFEPFFTTKAPGAGTGLGLAMCHGIVKQAGGSIAIDSELGQGTNVRIYLPCSGRAPSARVSSPPQPAPLSGQETLLVVEDEPMILRVAQTALERLGYRVLGAKDGLEGLEVAINASVHIDLLITDVVMPKLGGHELASRLQASGGRLKVLYTSGYAENAIAHHGVLLEGVHFLQKPYTLAALARCVREILDER